MSDSFDENSMDYRPSRKEWQRWVDPPAAARQESHASEALAALDRGAREYYNEARDEWHANFGIIATPAVDDCLRGSEGDPEVE